MLESGIYPSIQTIRKMKKKGFNYDAYDHSVAPHLKIGSDHTTLDENVESYR